MTHGTRSNHQPVVAFMQNQWVREPERLRSVLERHDEDFRRRMIARRLLAGCLSGRRLKAAFGDLCEVIVWEQASRTITGKPNECPPADRQHIQAVLDGLQPSIVICFGRIALDAVKPLFAGRGDLIVASHPAARVPETPEHLAESARILRRLLEQQPIAGSR